jgi:peptidyl-prolyl cis-trans isomerase D
MTDSDQITKKKPSRAQTSLLVWVLLALLITGLGGFGVTNFGRSVTAIGSVGDQEIEANAYARALRNQINALSRQFGQQLSLQEAKIFGLDAQVLNGLIDNAALDNEAQYLGLSVGDLTVAKRIAAQEAFKDVTGQFNADTYKLTLDQARLTIKEYEAGVRAEVARSVLQAAIVAGVRAPDALGTTLYSFSGEQRSFSVLPLSEATLPQPLPTATEADIQAFYTTNIATFTRPEAKRLTYAALRPETLAPDQPVDEDAVQTLYNDRIDQYVVPEKRLVERLVYPSDADAAAAKARLDAGETFEALVAARGLALEDIDLGDVSKSDLGAAGDAVFALTGPAVVGPLPSDLGPALFRMNAILAAQETTLNEVRGVLAQELQTAAAAKVIADQAPAIDDALAGGATLEDLARDFNMTLGTTDYVTGANDNDPIAADRAFATTADALQTDDFPTLQQMADGGVVALRLDSLVPPTPIPLDKVRNRVAEAQRAAALTTALTEQGSAAETAIKSGATLASQGAVTTVPPLTRDATAEAAPPAVIAAAFAMQPGEVRLLTLPEFTGLVQLDSVIPANPGDPAAKAALDAIKADAAQSMAQDIYDLYTEAMTTKGVLTIDQAVINSVQAQMN